MKEASIVATLYAIFSILSVSALNAKAEELNNYDVYGQNIQSGLYVAGLMWEQDKSGAVKAKIMDRLEVFDQCEGQWDGKGIAKVRCSNFNEYVLRVVER